MKRPLCICSVVFVAVLFFTLRFFPSNVWNRISAFEEIGEEEILGIRQGETVSLTGTIVSCQTKQQGKETITELILNHITFISPIQNHSTNQIDSNFKIKCYLNEEETVKIGQRVAVCGAMDLFKHATNPGEFDSALFYQNRGILFQIKQGSIRGKSREYNKWAQFLDSVKNRNEVYLSHYLEEGNAAVIKAMLFGDKEELDSETKERYQKNGIAHILAISGLHISMIGMGIFRLLRRLPIPQWLSLLLSASIIVNYGIMVGFSPSAFRAIFMFLLYLLSKVFKRTYDMMTALSASMMLFLLLHPSYLYDCGFQLSFAAILGIAVLLPTFVTIIPIQNKFLSAFLTSFSVFLATAPILVWHYHEISFSSLLLNMLVIPLMSILLFSAILLLVLANLFQPAAVFMTYPIRFILWIYEKSCLLSESIPVSAKNVAAVSLWRIFAYYLVLITLTVLVKTKKKKILTLLLIPVFLLLFWQKNCGFSVWMLDVGQGDCNVIFSESGKTYLIDGGSSSKYNVGEKIIIPFLKSRGINRVDAIFLSHLDEDHINGILELLKEGREEHIKIGCVFLFSETLNGKEEKLKEVKEAAQENGITLRGMSARDVLRDGDLTIQCLYPKKGQEKKSDNDTSLVLEVKCRDFQALFTGDLEEEGERELLQHYGQLSKNYTLLKVGHHGSDTSSSMEFLTWANPKQAIISCGKNNRYGHPHKETLERLEEIDCKVLRTDRMGAIEVNLLRREGGG
ncbi:MAG: DNA internalization-related competence protein ComEC/Rec2 [Lachnospiraceae bacterium]|nr:DNA internalization-related competence protein ComEC/Rec2 [Lachnospiraceae bacterium]